jgi:hypothetical protein
MKLVKEEHPPLTKDLKNLLPNIDFFDTFSTTNHVDSLELISNKIFNTTPKWVAILFSIRNHIANLIGLKHEIPKDYNEDFKIGGYIKFFRIFNIKEDEIILGANDKHLNFRAIISKTLDASYNIKVTTLVEYNNRLGKIYMTIVKPFHRIVVKRMVKNAYRS